MCFAIRASPLGYIKCPNDGKKKMTTKKMFEITPHRCTYKVKTIVVPTKITHFNSIFVVDQWVLLLWLVDLTMRKMALTNLVEAFGVANDTLQL